MSQAEPYLWRGILENEMTAKDATEADDALIEDLRCIGPHSDWTWTAVVAGRAAERIAASSRDVERLREALRELFKEAGWPEGGDIDAFWFQAWAIKHGFLRPETRTEPCGEDCNCASYYDPDEFKTGITCYRKADFLLAAPATPQEPT